MQDPNLTQQILLDLCRLRDDLFNQAMLTQPETFAGIAQHVGSKQFAVADMPPQSTAVNVEAYQNKGKFPVVVYVRVDPVMVSEPPAVLTIEQAVLLVNMGTPATNLGQAALSPVGAGISVPLLVRPNETLNLSVMASQAVRVSWRVLPLRGRDTVFGNAM